MSPAQFGTVTFLGSRIGHRKLRRSSYNGNVFLNNFHIGPGAGAGSLAGCRRAGALGLMMIADAGPAAVRHSVRERIGRRPVCGDISV